MMLPMQLHLLNENEKSHREYEAIEMDLDRVAASNGIVREPRKCNICDILFGFSLLAILILILLILVRGRI